MSLALCALNTLVMAMNSTLNFLSHIDESCTEETGVCGYNNVFLYKILELVWSGPDTQTLYAVDYLPLQI